MNVFKFQIFGISLKEINKLLLTRSESKRWRGGDPPSHKSKQDNTPVSCVPPLRGVGPQVNKNEQISSDHHKLSIAEGVCAKSDIGGGGVCYHVTYAMMQMMCLPPDLWKHYLYLSAFVCGNEPKKFNFQTLAQLLYKAAEDGDVDPQAVFNILKVGHSEAEGATGASGGGGSAGRAGQSKCMQFSLKDFFSLFFFCWFWFLDKSITVNVQMDFQA